MQAAETGDGPLLLTMQGPAHGLHQRFSLQEPEFVRDAFYWPQVYFSPTGLHYTQVCC